MMGIDPLKRAIKRAGSKAARLLVSLTNRLTEDKLGKKLSQAFTVERTLVRLAAAYFITLTLSMYYTGIGLDTLDYQQSVSLFSMIVRIVTIFVIITEIALVFDERVDFAMFAISLFALAWVICWKYRDYFVILGVAGVFVIFYLYAMRRGRFRFSLPALSGRAEKITTIAAVFLLVAIPAVFISIITCARYLNFLSPNYDFGIFVNMFHNMRRTGLPVTTNERNGLLSHFAIHLSPIYYLMLPFYIVFPSPLTLQIAQAVALGSSVIPMYLICREKKLGKTTALFLCAVVAFYPGMTGGTFYDFHENYFLMPLLLWMLCSYEKGRFIPTLIFALLVCTVKEDAPVYVVFFSLYAVFAKTTGKQSEQRARAAIYAGAALIYFALAQWYLGSHGGGFLDMRYGQYIPPGEGLAGLVRSVIVNPSFVFHNVFGVDTFNKLVFIVQMNLPLLFLPFAVRKPERLFLLCPMLLMNLMTNWRYQYEISFQYQFGSGAMLIYAALLSFIDLTAAEGSGDARLSFVDMAAAEGSGTIQTPDLEIEATGEGSRTALTNSPSPDSSPGPGPRPEPAHNKPRPQALALCMLCVTLFVYSAVVYTNFYAIRDFNIGKGTRTMMNTVLEHVPPDASVTASTYIIPHLANRDRIYELYNGTEDPEGRQHYNVSIKDGVPSLKQETEYIVIDMRQSGFSNDMYEYYASSKDWEVVAEARGFIAVLRDTTWQE